MRWTWLAAGCAHGASAGAVAHWDGLHATSIAHLEVEREDVQLTLVGVDGTERTVALVPDGSKLTGVAGDDVVELTCDRDARACDARVRGDEGDVRFRLSIEGDWPL